MTVKIRIERRSGGWQETTEATAGQELWKPTAETFLAALLNSARIQAEQEAAAAQPAEAAAELLPSACEPPARHLPVREEILAELRKSSADAKEQAEDPVTAPAEAPLRPAVLTCRWDFQQPLSASSVSEAVAAPVREAAAGPAVREVPAPEAQPAAEAAPAPPPQEEPQPAGEPAPPSPRAQMPVVLPSRPKPAEHPAPGFLLRAWSWLNGNRGPAAKKRLRVADTVSLGDKRFVAVVHVDGQKFLIGGGAAGVSLLTSLGNTAEAAEISPSLYASRGDSA